MNIETPTGKVSNLKPVPVSGTTQANVVLPSNTILPGLLQVSGNGDGGVGRFQASITAPEPIRLSDNLSPGSSHNKFFRLSWTGGDPNSLVLVRVNYVASEGGQFQCDCRTYASEGHVDATYYTMLPGLVPGLPAGDNVSITVTNMGDDPQRTRFGAEGLTLGGFLNWKYVYQASGIKLQ